MSQPMENSVGVTIEYQVLEDDGITPRDISTATVHQLIFKKPDRTLVTHEAVFSTDGTDGLLNIVTVDGDLAPGGVFQVSARLELPTFEGYTQVAIFDVSNALKAGKPYPNA